jgi:hypothetical protein
MKFDLLMVRRGEVEFVLRSVSLRTPRHDDRAQSPFWRLCEEGALVFIAVQQVCPTILFFLLPLQFYSF